LLFVLGKTALGIYYGTAQPGSGYGAAGSHTYSVWTSYSSMIIFYGAEFTKAYTDFQNEEIISSKNLNKIKITDR